MKSMVGQNTTFHVAGNQRGQTAIEVSFLMLPFLILLLGSMEFGWFFFQEHSLQYATREGMRLALVGDVLLDGGDTLSRVESIKKEIRDRAAAAMDGNAVQISIYKIGDNYEDPEDWETLQDAGNPADYMRIRTQYDYEFLTPLIGSFFNDNADPVTLSAEATYRNELFEEV